MKRSRVLYFHEEANLGKLQALEALSVEYRSYLQECIEAMVLAHRPSISRNDFRTFFPRTTKLSTNVALAVHNHAVEVVKSWFASTYQSSLKSRIKFLSREGALSELEGIQLFTIGKYGIEEPSETISQDAIDLYWSLLLEASSPPKVSPRMGMRLSVHTGKVKLLDLKLSTWWLSVSSLTKSKTLRFPLKANPFIRDPQEVRNGCLVRKDKRGRWRVEVLESKLPEAIPELPKAAPKLAVDIGLNALAATSTGQIFGSDVKPKFDRLYSRVRDLRANRQRQGLRENSPKLDILEDRLSGLVKTETGRVANKLVRSHPGCRFVLEDLDLRGCKGQKRFAYRALQSSLEKKACIVKVNPAYTSQTCPSCGYVARQNRHGIRFKCHGCGRISHADVVGAINLLRRSEDDKIGLDDDPSEVKRVLIERYRTARSSSSRLAPELLACSRRLTTSAARKGQTGIASNAEGKSDDF